MIDTRYHSRKWIIASRTLAIYVTIYVIEIAVMVNLRAINLISQENLVNLWAGSRMVFAAGILGILGLYKASNVLDGKNNEPVG